MRLNELADQMAEAGASDDQAPGYFDGELNEGVFEFSWWEPSHEGPILCTCSKWREAIQKS